MSTWISERFRIVLCLCLVTAACEGSGGFVSSNSGQGFANPRRDMSLQSADLAGGALTLTPPAGFCVDKRSLEPGFAIVARCDSLGARGPVRDAPLGMILVSVTGPTRSDVALGRALAALQPQGAETLETRVRDPVALAHLQGPTPEGIDRRHWRGLAQIGPHLLGLTAFAPTGGELSGPAGGRLLEQLVARTRDATAAQTETSAPSGPSVRPASGGVLSGLFD